MLRVVTMGGGTGHFVTLQALRDLDISITAIVSMADDGGSTGVLRDELGVLPPGDIRQCLVALSSSSLLLRNLMNYRFEEGSLGGHAFGNLLLSALEKVTGSFEHAVEEASAILTVKGKVIPITIQPVRLHMVLADETVLSNQKEIYRSNNLKGYRSLFLDPHPLANPRALQAIQEAEVLIFGPGDLYSSLLPLLVVEGVPLALKESKAKKIYIANLVNRKGQTDGFVLQDYINELSKYVGQDVFDSVIVNTTPLQPDLIQRYQEQGDIITVNQKDDRVIYCDIVSNELKKVQKGDLIRRNLIRHDPHKLKEVFRNVIPLS